VKAGKYLEESTMNWRLKMPPSLLLPLWLQQIWRWLICKWIALDAFKSDQNNSSNER